jgi:hypothetical protein
MLAGCWHILEKLSDLAEQKQGIPPGYQFVAQQ